jgi:hypothetical protein
MSLEEKIALGKQKLSEFIQSNPEGDIDSVIENFVSEFSEDEFESDALNSALNEYVNSLGQENEYYETQKEPSVLDNLKTTRDNLRELRNIGRNDKNQTIGEPLSSKSSKSATATLDRSAKSWRPPKSTSGILKAPEGSINEIKPFRRGVNSVPDIDVPKLPPLSSTASNAATVAKTPGATKAVSTVSNVSTGSNFSKNLGKSALVLNAGSRGARVLKARQENPDDSNAVQKQLVKETLGFAKDLVVQKLIQVAIGFLFNPAVLWVVGIASIVIILLGLVMIGSVAGAAHIFCTPLQIEKFFLQQVLDDETEKIIQSLCGTSACGGAISVSAGGVGFDCASNRIIIGSRFNFVDVRFLPAEANIYYALSMMKSQEFNGAQYTESFVGGDKDSCGPYQQRMREIANGARGRLAQEARRITGGKPIIDCKQVISDYGFGFFDQLAIERLKLEGVYDDLLAKNLSDQSQLREAAVLLCNSQRPDAYNVRARSCPSDSYYVNNIYAAGEQLVASNQYEKRKATCGVNTQIAKPKLKIINGKIDINFAKQLVLGVDANAQSTAQILNGTYTYTLSGNRKAGVPNSVRGGVLKHNDHVAIGPIYSPYNGEVIAVINTFPNNNGRWSLSNPDFGNQVLILISDGPYAGQTFGIGHINQEIPVSSGDRVVVGQQIGSLTRDGGSGSGTGPHFSTIVMDGRQTRMIDARANIAQTAELANLVITGDGVIASSKIGSTNGVGTASGGGGSSTCPTGASPVAFENGQFNQQAVNDIIEKFVAEYNLNAEAQKAGLSASQLAALEGGNKGCAFVTSRIMTLINPELGARLTTLSASDQKDRALSAGGRIITDPNQAPPNSIVMVFYENTRVGHTGIVYTDSNGVKREVSNRSSLGKPVIHGSPEEAARIYASTYGRATYVLF